MGKTCQANGIVLVGVEALGDVAVSRRLVDEPRRLADSAVACSRGGEVGFVAVLQSRVLSPGDSLARGAESHHDTVSGFQHYDGRQHPGQDLALKAHQSEESEKHTENL